MVLMIISPFHGLIAYQFNLVFHHLSGFTWMVEVVTRVYENFYNSSLGGGYTLAFNGTSTL